MFPVWFPTLRTTQEGFLASIKIQLPLCLGAEAEPQLVVTALLSFWPLTIS